MNGRPKSVLMIKKTRRFYYKKEGSGPGRTVLFGPKGKKRGTREKMVQKEPSLPVHSQSDFNLYQLSTLITFT